MNITFPRADFGLTLMYNDHKCYYERVSEFVRREEMGYELDDFISAAEMQKCIDLDECWSLQWYPQSSGGFIFARASTLEALMEWVNTNYPTELQSTRP